MGAINVYTEDDRKIVCDGQQRLTTLCLMLSAIRTAAFNYNYKKMISEIDDLLFCDVKKYQKWS